MKTKLFVLLFLLIAIPCYAGKAADKMLFAMGNPVATGVTLPAFTAVTCGVISTLDTSNTVTVTITGGSGLAVAITGSGCQYSKNSGAYTSLPGTTNTGDTFSIQQTSSGSYGTETTCTLTVNVTTSQAYNVTTVSAPNAPTSVAATAGNALVTMTWGAPSGGCPPTLYNIGCATSTGTETYATFTNVTSPSNVTSLTNGTPYFCNVQAVNAAGTHVGTEATATPAAPPSAPTALAAQNTADQQTSLTWTASGSPDSYNLYWVAGSSFSGACTSGGTKITGVTSGYAKTGLTDNTKYAYAVTEVKSGQESACSSTVTSTAKAPATFGDTSIEATASGFAGYAQDAVIYTSPSDAGNAPLISCTMYCMNGIGSTYTWKAQIWNSSHVMLANGYGAEVNAVNTATWQTSTFATSPILAASTNYGIGFVQNQITGASGLSEYYAAGAYTNWYNYSIASSYYTSPTDFDTGDNYATEAYKFSFYCTYIPQSP